MMKKPTCVRSGRTCVRSCVQLFFVRSSRAYDDECRCMGISAMNVLQIMNTDLWAVEKGVGMFD